MKMVLVNEFSCAVCRGVRKIYAGEVLPFGGGSTEVYTHLACVYQRSEARPRSYPGRYYFLRRRNKGDEVIGEMRTIKEEKKKR